MQDQGACTGCDSIHKLCGRRKVTERSYRLGPDWDFLSEGQALSLVVSGQRSIESPALYSSQKDCSITDFARWKESSPGRERPKIRLKKVGCNSNPSRQFGFQSFPFAPSVTHADRLR